MGVALCVYDDTSPDVVVQVAGEKDQEARRRPPAVLLGGGSLAPNGLA